MTSEFDGIERVAGDEVGLAIIWLHGLGADAGDFVPVVDALELPTGTRFVFPNAPLRPVSINGGAVMRAWYDIFGFGPAAPDDTAGLAASVELVGRLVERERRRGLDPARIVLAGFSQGGAVALHAGLGTRSHVGGIIGLSTYLPAAAQLGTQDGSLRRVPVWLAHGTFDPVIPLAFAEQSRRELTARGVDVEWQTYPMGHEVTPAEIAAVSRWLGRFAVT